MKIRGQRECLSCGTTWSYYETGEINCPACGSLHSVGNDDPTEHTATTAELDLTPVRDNIDDKPIRELGTDAAELTRTYIAQVGFIREGELEPLTETFLAALELRRVGTTFGRLMEPSDTETQYFLTLLRGADQGERPPAEEVPEGFYPERGLALAKGIEVYLSDMRELYTDPDPAVTELLSGIKTHKKRIEALDGDIEPGKGETLVSALRETASYLKTDDESTLAAAQDRLNTMQPK